MSAHSSNTSLVSQLEVFLALVLADVQRLKAENASLLATVAEKEAQIARLQDEIHKLHYHTTDDATDGWIAEEEEYVSIIKSLLK